MGKKIEVECPQCKDRFLVYRYDLENRKRTYCSAACQSLAKRIRRPSREELVLKYEEGLSTPALAKFYGVSKGTVYNWFKKYDIKTRTIGQGVSLVQTGRPASTLRKQRIGAAHRDRGTWQGTDHPNFKYPNRFKSRGKSGKRADLGGLYVRSTWEHDYALILNLWIEQGEVARWEYEPDCFSFPIKRGNRYYTPDFKVYYPDGHLEYHEVKGYMDPSSKTKIKRFRKYYPDLNLKVIDALAYKSLKLEYKQLLPGWEGI